MLQIFNSVVHVQTCWNVLEHAGEGQVENDGNTEVTAGQVEVEGCETTGELVPGWGKQQTTNV